MKLFSTLLMSAFVLQMSAAPTQKTKKTVTLLDGTKIEVSYWGDEYGCFYKAADGRMLQPVGDGTFFRYTDLETEELANRFNQVKQVQNVMRAKASVPSQGTYKIPVILVQFKDKSFSVASGNEKVAEFYDLYCNGTRDGKYYTGAGSKGAVCDYFVAQSDSALFWDFEIIGPVTLDKEAAYYGQDEDGKIDVNMTQFYEEAVAKAKLIHSDWTMFDHNYDGKLDMVFFLYAGLGQANGGDASTIWPKETHKELVVDGISFNISACCNELRPIKDGATIVGGQADGIGIMCHELSHALGLPDFYNARHDSFGMDYWSVMDYGYFARNGYAPGSYNGYERDFMGWRKLVVLDRPQTVHLKSLEEGGTAYKIVNDAQENEYYVLHNIQPKGWDTDLSGALGHGMIVTHVDYDEAAWNGNVVNTDVDHQRMTIIPANNNYTGNFSAETAEELLDALAGHPYPGKTGNTELTDESVPMAHVYAGEKMGKPIKQIEEKNGIVSFKFMPLGKLEKPDASSISLTPFTLGFQVSWPAVNNAQGYRLEYAPLDDLSEDAVQMIDSISSNSCRVTGLKEGVTYQFRVQAISDAYEDSPYSDWYQSDEPTLQITEMPAEETEVTVYSLQGVKVMTASLAVCRKQLPRGVYVVVSENYQGKLTVK